MSNAILEYSIINGIILLLILVYKKRPLTSAKYFLLLHLVFIAVIAERLFVVPLSINTWYTYSEFPLRFFFSPLFYLYVATYLNPPYRPSKKMLAFLFVPALLDILCCVGISVYAYSHHFTDDQRFAIIHDHSFYLLRSGLAVLYSLYLTVRVLRLIQDFLKKIKNVYADIDKIQLNWLRAISITNVVLWLIWSGYIVVECFHPVPREFYKPFFLFLSVLIITEGYFVVLKPDLAFEFILANNEIKENEETKEQLKDQTESDSYLRKVFERLEAYMNNEKAYTNNGLSLSIMATYLNEQPYMITKAIRIGCNDSFYNYVNRFRVRKFIEELAKPENDIFTIDTLSARSGFNSKATLHKYFKELTGLTPSIAQKKLKNGVEQIESLIKK